MTTERFRRCNHCQVTYVYQSSGPGCNRPLNDNRYCPDCQEAVLRALAAVPRRFEREWVLTREVALEQLLAAEEAANRTAIARRVGFPMFNLQTGEVSRAGFARLDDRYYRYEFWPGRESEADIWVEMERDLSTGSLRPWVDR